MKAKQRFFLAVVVLGLLMTGPFCVTSLLIWLDMQDKERAMLTELLLSRLPCVQYLPAASPCAHNTSSWLQCVCCRLL